MSGQEQKAESKEDVITVEQDMDNLKDRLEKLADYEEKEKRGQIIEFPVEIGDKLYYKIPEIDEIIEYEVVGYKVEPKVGSFVCLESEGFDKVDIGVRHIGKRWFRTRQEAEQSGK